MRFYSVSHVQANSSGVAFKTLGCGFRISPELSIRFSSSLMLIIASSFSKQTSENSSYRGSFQNETPPMAGRGSVAR